MGLDLKAPALVLGAWEDCIGFFCQPHFFYHSLFFLIRREKNIVVARTSSVSDLEVVLEKG
jgi:hypothetical protein